MVGLFLLLFIEYEIISLKEMAEKNHKTIQKVLYLFYIDKWLF